VRVAGRVSVRTALVNAAARGLVKSYGERLRKCGTQQVSRGMATGLSAELREALEPLLREVESLNERIKEYDRRIEQIAKKDCPEVALLHQVKGVGELISLSYILTIEDRIDSRRAVTSDVFSGRGLGGGTLGKASHRCTSARKGIAICERC